jgi:hypothetical protein
MNHPLRVFFFAHYWWITPLLAIVSAVVVVQYSRPDNVSGNLIALCTVALGIIYFVQKQRADDLQLFERLFSQFNTRYAAMHERLQPVASGDVGDVGRDREVLDAYFNLCAEEYLFFRQGRILPTVWQAWCRGMLDYLKQDRFRAYWEREQCKGSHYGLTEKVIRAGAGLPPPTSGVTG